MTISLICISLLGLLVLVGAFAVTIHRGKSNTLGGYSTDDLNDPLFRAVRAHGNAVEYVPLLMVVMYILGQGQPAFWVEVCMAVVTLARYLTFFGLYSFTMAKPNPLRFIGSLLTYVVGVALCIALLLSAV